MFSYATAMIDVIGGLHRPFELVTCPTTRNAVAICITSRRIGAVNTVVKKWRMIVVVLAKVKSVRCGIATVMARLANEGYELLNCQVEWVSACLSAVTIVLIQGAKVVAQVVFDLAFVGTPPALYIRVPSKSASVHIVDSPAITAATPVYASTRTLPVNRFAEPYHGIRAKLLASEVFHSGGLFLTGNLSHKATTTKCIAVREVITTDGCRQAAVANTIPVALRIIVEKSYGLYSQATESLSG